MGRLITRRIVTALLSISFALGIAMSNAQAASMMVQMATAAEMGSDMGMSGNHDCGGCTDKSDMKTMVACDQNCVAPLAAILPATFAVADAQPVLHVPAPASPEFDRAPTPDPSPPRS
jgi:hypothetical protein